MKPLAVLDHLYKDFAHAPMIDVSLSGLFVLQARENAYDLRTVEPPAPVVVVGLRIETIARSLLVDPYPPFFLNIGHPVELAFVVCNLPNLVAFPYVVLKDGRFGNIDIPVIIDSDGQIVPERKISPVNYQFDQLYGRWFRAVVDCFWMLQRSMSLNLQPVPLDLTHSERRK